MASRKVKAALTKTQRRKKEHLELCLDTESVASPTSTGLERFRFLHNALPELDIDELDLSTEFLTKTQRRKKEHLELCLDTESVASPTSTGLERYRFLHNALPELDIDDIDLSTD